MATGKLLLLELSDGLLCEALCEGVGVHVPRLLQVLQRLGANSEQMSTAGNLHATEQVSGSAWLGPLPWQIPGEGNRLLSHHILRYKADHSHHRTKARTPMFAVCHVCIMQGTMHAGTHAPAARRPSGERLPAQRRRQRAPGTAIEAAQRVLALLHVHAAAEEAVHVGRADVQERAQLPHLRRQLAHVAGGLRKHRACLIAAPGQGSGSGFQGILGFMVYSR